MSNAERFLETYSGSPAASTTGKYVTVNNAREYARLKSKEDTKDLVIRNESLRRINSQLLANNVTANAANAELVEALRKIKEISGTANRSAFNQIKDAVNDIQEIAETELAKHSK